MLPLPMGHVIELVVRHDDADGLFTAISGDHDELADIHELPDVAGHRFIVSRSR